MVRREEPAVRQLLLPRSAAGVLHVVPDGVRDQRQRPHAHRSAACGTRTVDAHRSAGGLSAVCVRCADHGWVCLFAHRRLCAGGAVQRGVSVLARRHQSQAGFLVPEAEPAAGAQVSALYGVSHPVGCGVGVGAYALIVLHHRRDGLEFHGYLRHRYVHGCYGQYPLPLAHGYRLAATVDGYQAGRPR